MMMNQEDVEKLWYPAAERLKLDYKNLQNRGDALDDALGVNYFEGYRHRGHHQDRPMPDGPFKELLKALAGPHGKTILRAYQIKHGIKHEDSEIQAEG